MQDFPHQPQDEEGPVFKEPWEAQAFALVIALHQQGRFTWPEWAAALSEQIVRAQEAGDPDLGDSYYQHWLAALESLSREKQLASMEEMQRRRSQWRSAYLDTEHGKPVELSAGDSS